MTPLITPALLGLVEDELIDVYTNSRYPMPTAADVVATVLAKVVTDMHTEARAYADCQRVDTCTAEAIAHRGIADALSELAAQVVRDGLPAGEMEGA